MGKFALQAIKVWLAVRSRHVKDDETALFISRRGHRISARGVQQRVRIWAVKQKSKTTPLGIAP